MSSYYNTRINKAGAFTAYGRNFEPHCLVDQDKGRHGHAFHIDESDQLNTSLDLTLGIWDILKFQASWLEGKLKNDNVVSQYDFNRLRDEIKNMVASHYDLNILRDEINEMVLNGLEEKLKNAPYKGVSMGDLNRQTQEFRNMVLEGLDEKLKNNNLVSQDDLNRLRDEIKNMILNGLEEKLKNAPYKGVSKEDLNHQTQEFGNTMLKSLDEKFKNLSYKGVTQEDLNKQTQEFRIMVKGLDEKFESSSYKDVPQADLNSQALEILKSLEEKLKNVTGIPTTEKGYGVTQEDMNRQTQEFRNIVKLASRTIESQNDKILDKFIGIKARIEKIMNEDLDKKFGHIEKVIRECLEDVELRISYLKEQGRNIMEKVIDNSGKTEIEKLILENNMILKKIENKKLATQTDIKNIKIAGLEQLVKDKLEDLEKQIDPKTLVRKIDLKQESILEKIEENHNIIKNLDTGRVENIIQNKAVEIKGMLTKISEKFEKMPWDKSVEEELGKAEAHLQNIAQLIGMETVEK